MDVGIIGCGAIGSDIAHAAEGMSSIGRVVLFDLDTSKAVRLVGSVTKASVASSPEELIGAVDVVCEAASQEAVREYLDVVLGQGKDLIVMSVGALYDDDFRDHAESLAAKNRCKIRVPTGAVCGVDGVMGAHMAGLHTVTLVTTKPPRSLGLDCTESVVVFDGPAREAIQRFPKNVNVSATLSLAGLGFDETKVRIIADPETTQNTHHIRSEGDFGRLEVEVENLPNPNNPSSSYMASLSAIACLKRLSEPIVIG